MQSYSLKFITQGNVCNSPDCSGPGSMDTGLRGNLMRFLRHGESIIQWVFEKGRDACEAHARPSS